MSINSISNWHQFLTQHGAQWDAGLLTGFQEPRESVNRLSPLEHQALLLVSGADAEKFLQGQTTADMRRLTAGQVLLGAHCDHKGRMHSSFTAALAAFGESSAIALRIHSSLAETASAALQKYIVFSKADLALADDWRILELQGESAATVLQSLGWQVPMTDKHFTATADGTLLRLSASSFELWLPHHNAEKTWLALAPHCRPAAPVEWDLEQIRLGLGQVRAETVGEFIPQMLNFQKVGGISFDKGCYTGQEVVARMHYLGKSKKHMYRASVVTDQAVSPATSVFSEGASSPVGHVVIAAPANELTELLFVCSETAVEQKLALREPGGPELHLQSLPYSLE